VQERIDEYFGTLARLIRDTEVADRSRRPLSLACGFLMVRNAAHAAHDGGNKIMFIGNGGSASIASHLAIDFSKNRELRALAFNDPAALTCVANDLGYENVFAKPISVHARPGDLLIAISSSGRSPNMLAATAAAREHDCGVITFSGFDEDNDLRQVGDVNFYVRSREYGFVEVAHLSLCHAVLDLDVALGESVATVGAS
jgi:D-sedoheptulose 7-phosphate isomerase